MKELNFSFSNLDQLLKMKKEYSRFNTVFNIFIKYSFYYVRMSTVLSELNLSNLKMDPEILSSLFVYIAAKDNYSRLKILNIDNNIVTMPVIIELVKYL